MRLGILALQGDFAEHTAMLRRLGVAVVEVRLPAQLEGLAGLIIPGGESTTIAKLAVSYGLIEPLRKFGQDKPIWGTCAGAIFMSRDVHRDQPLLQLMDITVERNAFGRQVDSFEVDLPVPALGKDTFRAIFIRAPFIEKVGSGVEVLAKLDDGTAVAARQKNLLACAFHPELNNDLRFHDYFIRIIGHSECERQ